MSTDKDRDAAARRGPQPDSSAPDPGGPGPVSDGGEQHDPAGLDLAKSVAAGARAKPRKGSTSSRTRTNSESSLSGAHPDARDPALIGNVVERIVADGGWDTDIKVHGVFARWPSIVGPELAAHCTPTSFGDGHLEVRTDSTAWATQLRLLAPSLVRRLNEELGHDTVQRINVLGPEGPTWRRGRRSVRGGRGPRDTYG